jgi:penicillin V acylase-like amidase (Ntn superfamily)
MRKNHIMIIIFFLSALFISSGDVLTCSEIYIEDNSIISARNFDFLFGDGIAVITPRGTSQKSAYANNDEKPLSWTSKYGSVIFNVKFPTKKSIPASVNASGFVLAGVDGMNEYGFKVGSYYLETLELPKADKRPALATASLMQYFLDNFKTVKEAVSDVKSEKYRVIQVPADIKGDIMEIKLHFYIHDPSGDSAILEYINGKLKVHLNPPVRVLTNTIYDESLTILKNYEGFGGKMYIPGGTQSTDRFVRGAYYLKHLPAPKSPEEAIAYGFSTVQLMSESPGFEHGFTQWTIVSDVKNRKIFFRTVGNPQISFLDLNKLDFSEGQPVRYLDFLKKDLSGNVGSLFTEKGKGWGK